MTQMFKNADIDESSTLTPNEVLTLNYEMLFPRYPRFGYKEQANEKSKLFLLCSVCNILSFTHYDNK